MQAKLKENTLLSHFDYWRSHSTLLCCDKHDGGGGSAVCSYALRIPGRLRETVSVIRSVIAIDESAKILVCAGYANTVRKLVKIIRQEMTTGCLVASANANTSGKWC